MKEILKIDWLLLIAPLLWCTGIAGIIGLLGIMEFKRFSEHIHPWGFLKSKMSKITFIICFALIFTGFLLTMVKIPPCRLIVRKIENLTPNDISQFQILINREFLPEELMMDPKNHSHLLNSKRRKNDPMVLFWDGYIQTPFLRFDEGDFTIEFLSKGTKADNEWSQIKIQFEIIDKNNFLITKDLKYFNPTDRMSHFRLIFHNETSSVGRIRLVFFNDLYIPDTKEGRDVWIKDLKIVKR